MSTIAISVTPKMQKVFLVAVLLTWILPLIALLSFGRVFLLHDWRFILLQTAAFTVPVIYALLGLWLLPKRTTGTLARIFYATLVAFVTYSLVAIVAQILQNIAFHTVYRSGSEPNFWYTYGTYFGPMAVGAVCLVFWLITLRRKHAHG